MSHRVCVFFIIYLTNINIFAAVHPEDCFIDIPSKNTDKLSPVLVHNHTSYFDLVIPEKGIVKLKHGERITFACTDNRNYLTATNSNSTYATCIGGDVFKVVRNNMHFDDLKCKKSVRGDIQKTRKKCGNNKGYFINIGYRITKTDWITIIKVCYDENTGETFYTEHILHGEAIKYATKSTYRPAFSTEGLGSDIAASVAYKQTFQKSTFNKLLGSAGTAGFYINGKSYLSRGHLSPVADFLYDNSQRTTYYYLNTCPQWQVINGGNWKRLEITIRKTAENYNDTFKIITGTYGVLSLNDVNNNEKEIFLVSGDKLPVPKYIWKIIYHEASHKGIVLIVLNNPFSKSIRERDLLCENICDMYGWSSNSWSDVNRGYVHCCDLNYFSNQVDTAPMLKVNGVLHGISSL